ncbi:solute carrier family 22 member 4-like [Acanthochromis polyacanthus]|uniref:solute carrier family 22 member 4-like n=1 Tax=Acanthochromis polyacanthus TaxID=80966 RepID=UPI0022347407|nr:solute carrier family 22 member 4-like [Acanthochromis polyacanthus]
MQNYEESVSFLGPSGPFQRRVFVLLCLTSIPCGYNMLSVIFLLAIPPHHCHIPASSNLSQEWIQASIPVQVAGQPERSSCSRYSLDVVQNLSAVGFRPALDQIQNQSVPGGSPEVVLTGLQEEECRDGWTYSTEYYQSTVVTEFDLVCGDEWKQPLTSLVYFLGGLCGCFISGQISDRFGRKPVLFGSIAILSIFSAAASSASSWLVFTVLFFILGVGQISCYIVIFVLGSEILIGPSRFLFSQLCLPSIYVCGMLLLCGTAHLFRNWRYLSLAMAAPGLAFIPFWWWVPESPRWLVSRGRLQEAESLLRLAALENRVEAPPVIFLSTNVDKVESQKAESVSFLDLLRTKNIRNITLMLWLIWFSMSVCYFGLSFDTSSLSGNPYLNYFLLSVVEIPAYAASWGAARHLPRCQSFMSFVMVGAIALLFIFFTLHSHPTLTLVLVLLGKFGVMAGTSVLYMYTGELFPTVIRNTAMSSCAMFSRVGSSLSPFLLHLAVFGQFLPWILVAFLSFLGALLCIFLPETFKRSMPDTIQQMQHTRRFRLTCVSSTLPPEDYGKSAKDLIIVPDIICTTRL